MGIVIDTNVSPFVCLCCNHPTEPDEKKLEAAYPGVDDVATTLRNCAESNTKRKRRKKNRASVLCRNLPSIRCSFVNYCQVPCKPSLAVETNMACFAPHADVIACKGMLDLRHVFMRAAPLVKSQSKASPQIRRRFDPNSLSL